MYEKLQNIKQNLSDIEVAAKTEGRKYPNAPFSALPTSDTPTSSPPTKSLERYFQEEIRREKMDDLTSQIQEARSSGHKDEDILGYIQQNNPEVGAKVKEALSPLGISLGIFWII